MKQLKFKLNYLILLEFLTFVLMVFLVNKVNQSNFKQVWEFERSDILQEFYQGIDIGAGENPYNKILSGDLLINRKYATLLPLYYYLVFAVAAFSGFVFEHFVVNFRTLNFIAEVIASLFIYLAFRRQDLRLVGFMAAGFFMFNRWTIETFSDVKQDFIAIAFLVASLYFFKTKIRLSYLLYGLSLGIKHLGVFMLPMYIAPLLLKERKPKEFFYDILLFLVPTLGVALPFIIQNFKSFIFSMLFSFTRKPATTSVSFGYDKLLVLYKVGVENNTVLYYLIPRIPIVVFYALNTALLFLKKIPSAFYAFSSMFVFMAFNPVLFDQYLTWLTPLVYFSFLDFVKDRKIAKA